MDHFFQIEENPISMVLLGGENSCLRGWNLLTSSAATLRRLPFWSIPLYQTHLHRKKPSWHRPCWMMDSSRPLLILELCCFCTGLSRAEEGEKSSDVGGGSIFRAIETRGIAQVHYSPAPAHWTQQRARTSTSHADDRLLQRRLKPCTLIFYLYFILFFLSLK